MFPTALALLLCNMDRIVMSVAILPMSAEFGWAPGMQVHGAHGDVQLSASSQWIRGLTRLRSTHRAWCSQRFCGAT